MLPLIIQPPKIYQDYCYFLVFSEEAFDTLKWSFIQRTLRHFNFGPTINNWIKIFYNKGTKSCIIKNRWSSGFFQLEKGVRQGCPLSPYLFVLCVEILVEAKRKISDIKGMTANAKELNKNHLVC